MHKKNDVVCLLNWKDALLSDFDLKSNWGLQDQNILKVEGNKRTGLHFECHLESK